MKKVIAFGTFDWLHKGHIEFLKQAKQYGRLTVVIARDKTVKLVKGSVPLYKERIRLANIKNLKIADKVVLGNLIDKYKVIEKEKPDIICLGYDQEAFTAELKDALKRRKIKARIIRLNAYKPNIYKSSKLSKAKSLY